MRSAADMQEVGWPDPASVVQRMLSTRNWAANSCQSFTRISSSYRFIEDPPVDGRPRLDITGREGEEGRAST